MSEPIPHIEDQIKATLLGQCIGDAIGLLTEFMIKEEAKKVVLEYYYVLSFFSM